jgi:RNA polymerase sigma factor (sigma-70 family)
MKAPINEVVNSLRRAAPRQEEGGLTDGQLLARFIEHREQAALAALVQRHGPMVWGVCRRLLRNHHDAEDAFQATFLVLVRKAVSIRQREMMANWLYGVAHQKALKARAMIAKRRTREKQGTAMPEPQAPEQDIRNDLQPLLLDQELSRLPDKYRVAIVLCDLEGKTRQQAARQLSLPEGTLAGRLTRGRAMLTRRLARRGLAVSGGALAAVFSQEAASAGVPTSVVASTIKAASLFAAGRAAATGAISGPVAALTEGINLNMTYDYPGDPAKLGVALLQAEAGDKALARKTLQRAADLIASLPEDDRPSRARALTKLACAQARVGEFATARKTRERIQHETGKAIALATLVRQLARAGRAKEAMPEIDPLPVGTTKVHALTHLGAGQAEAGEQKAARASFQQAHLLIEQLPGEEDRLSQGSILATVRAEAGDYKGAIQTAETYSPQSTLGSANIAFAHAKAGDFTGALEIAEKLKNRVVRLRPGAPPRQVPDWWKLRILRATAELQAQRGDSKAALKWIDRLDSHLARAWALTGIAEGMLTTTRPPGKK